ncbi:cytochrome P450 [Ceratobasidium sp. AG-I]|nr:cytochrome P450 [Ceratobasidium sp. AG-I]
MASTGPVSVKELVIAVSITALGIYLVNRLAQPSKLPLPPGPKSLPIVGHLFSMPRSDEPIAFAKMSKKLNSDIIALNILGQTIVVLNSVAVTTELLDKRSATYSGRARIPVLSDVEFWKQGRRMLHSSLHKGVLPQYHPNQERLIQILLSRLLDSPPTFETLQEELIFAIGSTLINATYGYTPQSPQDKWLKAAQEALEHAVQTGQPAGTFSRQFHPGTQALTDLAPWNGLETPY